jgi:hypothetical protein
VTGGWLAAALALSALPEGTARWRMELSGEPVGAVELSVRCDGPHCRVRWDSRQRLPADAGGGIRSRRLEVEVDREGRAAGPARVDEGGRSREVALPARAVPAMLVELLLVGVPAGAHACLDAVDEATGRPFRACGRRGRDGSAEVEARGERVEVRPGPGPFPAEVRVPAQGVRFALDPSAGLPARAPRLFGVRVPGPDDPREAGAFCGVARDPEPAPGAADGLPRPAAAGATCRERTAAWLAGAREAGLRGRTAVGVAHDGTAFVWHAWAEVEVGGVWVPVDPSFRQAPARGPRFTLATWAEGDEAGRAAAGRRILACWGRAGLSPPGSPGGAAAPPPSAPAR